MKRTNPQDKVIAIIPEPEAKRALKRFITKNGLLEQTLENLKYWKLSWETATSSRIRACAGDAYFHRLRFERDGRQNFHEENDFFEKLTAACGLRCPKAYDHQVHATRRNK